MNFISAARFLFFIFLSFNCFSQTAVNYKIFYSRSLSQQGLKVQLSYNAPKAQDSTVFNFPAEVWGESDLHKCLHFLKEENPGYTFRLIANSDSIVIRHPRTKSLSFTYCIKQDEEDKETKSIYRPKIKDNYFQVLGHSLFMVPRSVITNTGADPLLHVTIEWSGFPPEFKLCNTFNATAKKQSFRVKLWDDLYNSFFVGGDYRIYSFEHNKKPVYFAIRGAWMKEFSDENIFNTLKKTIATQREFWNDNSFDYYTVIMSPTVSRVDSGFRGNSMTGSSVKNGFLIQSSNNPFNNWNNLRNIFNHEMMHDWIGGKIKMKHEELNYWFSEGFTDYYAYKNRLRNGDINFEEWKDLFNKEVFKAHYKNPEKNKPNYILKDDFWKSRNIEKLPYRRGCMFAFWLDNQILLKSNYTTSLDDLMRELHAITTKENKLFTDELLLDLVQKYIGKDISYFFQKHIISAVEMEWKNEELIPLFKIEMAESIPVLKLKTAEPAKYLLKG
jgi:predicted metalloprotease with PDZ domain